MLFETTLRPRRPLGNRQIQIVIGGLSVVWCLIGLGFWAAGAWPVMGFMGLDVLLLWLALTWHSRARRFFERLELRRDRLYLERSRPFGRREWASFNPAWVSVREVGRDGIEISEAGNCVRIGRFLAPDERRTFLTALKDGLRNAKAPLFTA
ncbi:MAG: DUF2244 domain-containing protein [Rhodospirillales bacterium]